MAAKVKPVKSGRRAGVTWRGQEVKHQGCSINERLNSSTLTAAHVVLGGERVGSSAGSY